MEKFFPAEKLILTGNPVRREIYDNQADRSRTLGGLGLDAAKKTVLIFGGILGARTINNAVEHSASTIEKRKDINCVVDRDL